MTVVSGIFLLSACFCVLMLFVLSSLLRYHVAGVKEWIAANVVAFVAFVLYAWGRELPPLLAYEAANGSYALAGLLVLAGFRRFFERSVPLAAFAAGLLLFVAAIALFHYVWDSFALRTLAVSAFQVVILSAIALTIVRAGPQGHARYPYLFTATTATLLVIGNAVRAMVHAVQSGEAVSLLQPSLMGIIFMSVGAFVLPTLSFGAMMMVHDRMLSRTGNSARRDFLTGAMTRSAFLELLEHECLRSRRWRKNLTVLMLDVDHMKSINEEFGHAAGDQLLVDIVLQADKAIRSVDSLARLGGEEFAVLLPETDHLAALGVAQRLLALMQPSGAGLRPECTVSIGFATLCDEDEIDDLLARAAGAMVTAKAAGGNRVVCAETLSIKSEA